LLGESIDVVNVKNAELYASNVKANLGVVIPGITDIVFAVGNVISELVVANVNNAGPPAPVAPVIPVAPVMPVTPVTPVMPVAPVTPVIPVAPVTPVDPGSGVVVYLTSLVVASYTKMYSFEDEYPTPVAPLDLIGAT
jgi:hypothetical protein